MEMKRASEIDPKAMPCPSCGNEMRFYGGSAGYICCEYKVLFRTGGWFDQGHHIKDERLAGGTRRVDGHVRKMQ
jgi:hypothetical protein